MQPVQGVEMGGAGIVASAAETSVYQSVNTLLLFLDGAVLMEGST
jgi:hypothetical protein